MRRLFLLPVLAILLLALVLIAHALPASAMPLAAPSGAPMPGPVCAFVCDKTGINTGWSIRGPDADYQHAQRLGMGWIMEIAGGMQDVNKTAEAINRANANGLKAIVRICSGNTCDLDTPAKYSTFLHQVAKQAPGEFWALMGPNEPDLEHWAGDGTGVAKFMNGTLSLVSDIPKLKKLSPAFNLTNRATPGLLHKMDAAGAQWAGLDGFAGTSYNLGGHPAYGYYTASGMRTRVLKNKKPFIFIETGTFAMVGKSGEHNRLRAAVVTALRKDFGLMVNDPTVMGVLYFNAFGDNPSMRYHVLYDSELVTISQDAACTGGGYSPVGVGVSTKQQTWQANGAPACTTTTFGCPFVQAAACAPDGCIDNDGDGFYGDGGSCTRNDCNDSDPSAGQSCGDGAADQTAGWGTLRVVDANVPAPAAWPVIRLGANNLPVIGYESGRNYQGDVTFLQCADAGCTTALRRVVVGDNNSGEGLSMQVRGDGRPIFAYLNATDYYLETYDCADAACSTGSLDVQATQVGQNGFATSLTVLPGDVPSIAFWASGSSDLGVVSCLNGSCGSTTAYIWDSNGQTGLNPTIYTNKADGLPYVVYTRADLGKIRLLECSNAACSAKQAKADIILDATTLPGTAVVMRPDGTPLILDHHETSGDTASLYSCANPACSSGSATDIYTASGQLQSGSIALLPDGKPFIVLADADASSGGTDLVLITCQDAACASTSVERLTGGVQVEHPDVVVRTDGSPLVVYHDASSGRLMVYDVDLSLVTGPQPTSTPTVTPTPTDDPGGTPVPTPVPTRTPTPWAAPALKLPLTNSLVRGTPAFSWGKVKGASFYEFQYAADFEFGSPIWDSGSRQGVTVKPPPMDKGIYFWRVRAGAGSRWTEWSVPRTIQIALILPTQPKLLLPRSGVKSPLNPLNLSWGAVAGAAQYDVWIARSNTFSGTVTKLAAPGASTSAGPFPAGIYYWRVRGLNADHEAGPWSLVWKFIIP